MRVAWLYVMQILKSRLAYRWDFLTQFFGELVGSAVSFAFLAGVFAGTGVLEIGGWPRETILFIYGFSMVSFGVYELVAESLYHFSEQYLIEGRLDQVLLRPFSALAQVVLADFNLFGTANMLAGGTAMVWAGSRLGLSWGPFEWASAAVLAVSGGVILVSVFLVLTCVNFWFEDRLGLQPPVFNCVVFGRYPIEIFHPAIRFFLRFVIPFAFIGYYPAGLFVAGDRWGPETYRVAWMTPVVAAATALAAGLLWRAGIRRYHSTGS